ncbi:hypothetical protein TgHK011_002848 [Trichoderma gracile]|nr:hypothetical protein TgHK011_002848 [Trichoderma gracile]
MASAGDARLLKSTKFPPEFSQKVDMQKVNLQVIKKWIANRISEILGNEDDVVIELCFNLIDGPRYPDIKSLQIQLTGFLDKDTAPFCKELWKLLLSAQGNPQGVPKELLEAKKLELMQEKMEADRAAENARKRRDDFDRRDREDAVGIGLPKVVAEEAMAGAGTDHDRPSLGTALLAIRTDETAMSHDLEAGGVAIVAGNGDEVAHRPGQRQTDPAPVPEAAVHPAALAALEALHAAKNILPDTETLGRGLGLLAVMLTDRGGSHATEGTVEMLVAAGHHPPNASRLRQSEDGNPSLEVGQETAEDVIQPRRRPVRGAPRPPAAAAPFAAVLDPLIALDQALPHSAALVANGVIAATVKTMKPWRGARILTGRDEIAPLRPRLHQIVANRLMFWKMNRVLRTHSYAACQFSIKRPPPHQKKKKNLASELFTTNYLSR